MLTLTTPATATTKADYPASYLLAVSETLRRERGFVDDPNDRGGATAYGISLRYLRAEGLDVGDIDGDGDIDIDDIRALTPERARQIYYERLWLPQRYDRMPPDVAFKVFDLAVNMGPGSANRLLQAALRAVGHRVGVDGGIGPETLGAVEKVMLSPGLTLALVAALRVEAAHRYRRIVALNPVRCARYERGWLRRAYDEAWV